ncbi:MAG: hypothetical protein WBX15_21120 [Thermoanaerobaculia bacterium]
MTEPVDEFVLLSSCHCCRTSWRSFSSFLAEFETYVPPPYDRLTEPLNFIWQIPIEVDDPELEISEVTDVIVLAVEQRLADFTEENNVLSLAGVIRSGADH